MSYFHPALESIHKDLVREGFLSIRTLRARDKSGWTYGDHRIDPSNLECRTLVCSTYEDAVTYAEAYYGPSISVKIIEIEGEYPCYPIKGTLVPEGTMFLLGEIAPEFVRVAEPEAKPAVAGPKF